jgi:hypothetical protein
MALLNTDLFVIQRPTDDGKHFKLTGEKLKEYIAAGDTIVYKGSRDFTQSAQDPSTDGTGVNVGDIYINNHPNAGATGGWAANINGEDVDPGDRAIWNGTSWDLLHDSSDAGVTTISGIEPIEVDDATPGEPIISVNAALETSATIPTGRVSRSGVVSAIAVDSDVVANDGVASPNPEAVVPADLLKATNDEIVLIDARVTVNEGDITTIEGDITDIKQDITDINTEIGDLTLELESITNGGSLSALKGEDPIVVATELVDDTAVEGDPDFGKTETTVSIKDGTTVQKGAVQLQEIGSAVSTSTTVAATPGYVGTYYLVKDFSSFADA